MQLVGDGARDVGGDRKADAAAGGGYGSVDADYFAAYREQRPARVARIYRRIGLDEVEKSLAVAGLDFTPSLGRDDSDSDRVIEAERVADGHHPLTDANGVAVAQGCPRQRGSSVDL